MMKKTNNLIKTKCSTCGKTIEKCGCVFSNRDIDLIPMASDYEMSKTVKMLKDKFAQALGYPNYKKAKEENGAYLEDEIFAIIAAKEIKMKDKLIKAQERVSQENFKIWLEVKRKGIEEAREEIKSNLAEYGVKLRKDNKGKYWITHYDASKQARKETAEEIFNEIYKKLHKHKHSGDCWCCAGTYRCYSIGQEDYKKLKSKFTKAEGGGKR